MPYKTVSLKMMNYVALTFFASLLLNSLSLIIYFVGPPIQIAKNHSSLPLTPRPVALTYTERDDHGPRTADESKTLYPPGKGFVQLDGSYYLVSMYHQIHCINSFRRSFEEYRSGLQPNVTDSRMTHIVHCLSYLRQSVLCNADTSLEPAHLGHTVNGEVVHAAYGGEVTHECKDWTEVHKWVENNHKKWEGDDNFEVL